MNFDIKKIRTDFPLLERDIYGRRLVYFDNAATTQKPQTVIKREEDFYMSINSNVHRGVHFLSQEATKEFEEGRDTVCRFINTLNRQEIIFTKGTTESINLVASAFGKKFVNKDDEVIISLMEHHSNIVPWQIMCENYGAILRVIPISAAGEIDMAAFEDMLNEKTKLVAVNHVSNTLGTINPVREIIGKAHDAGAYVLIDGAQAVAHTKIDVQLLDCDFYCFSGHKMYGPMGIGILYGKEKLLEEMPPYQTGGEMISTVTFEKTTYNELPYKFEAGTPNVAGVLGLDEAIKYMASVDIEKIALHENELLNYATEKLLQLEGLKIFGNASHKASVLSFLIENIHPYDAGTIIDKFGIAVRTGHLCTQPLADFYGIPGFIRASFAFYNTRQEIDRLFESIVKVREMLL